MGLGYCRMGGALRGVWGFGLILCLWGLAARRAWAWDGDNKRVDFAICFGSPRLSPDFWLRSGLEALSLSRDLARNNKDQPCTD